MFCSSLFAGKQNNVILRGSARDASGEPAAYATAFISKADGSIAAGVSADADGVFELFEQISIVHETVFLVVHRHWSVGLGIQVQVFGC